MREPHEHTFTNPMGMVFDIALYEDAPGALNIGNPTAEFSWFPNYAWSMALCENCKSHLGWWFLGTDKFVALIIERIIR